MIRRLSKDVRGQLRTGVALTSVAQSVEGLVVNAVDARESTLGTLCDNTPAVAWQTKGSVTTTGAASYLLRESSLHQRKHRYLHRLWHIPGLANVMADDTSRLFQLSNSQLVSHFATNYPLASLW